MRLARRFPKNIAERRLREIIYLATISGRNVKWLTSKDFTIIDWSRHVRVKAVNTGNEYVLKTF